MSLRNISKSYPELHVLDEISLGIARGDRIGIIGRNGSGKSTLLDLICGVTEADAGSIIRSNSLRIARLDQDPTFDVNQTVATTLGNSRAAIALAHKLGLTDAAARCGELSGGQRKRLALAQTLGVECDLLILDEPTNHLDVDTIDWLEDHLHDRKEAILLVTHDRYLLDRVANRVVEIHNRNLFKHQGTYAEYLEAVAVREVYDERVEHRLQRRLKTEIEWLRRSPKARTSKSKARINQAYDLLAQQRSQTRQDLTIDLPSRRLGTKVVDLEGVGKRYGERWVLRHVEHRLHSDARIGVVGPNGSGKTTLLSLIAGRLEPDEGRVVMGDTVCPGWYGQDPRPIPSGDRVVDVVREHADQVVLSGGQQVSGAQLLERFQFSRDQQQSTIGDLSGGERRRLELLLSLLEVPNLLLLDEPTNDLDIETLSVLEEYLDVWTGAVVVASHDRYFLERTCTDIFSITNTGSVLHHPGGWVAYRNLARSVEPQTQKDSTKPTRRAQESKKLGYIEQRELDMLTQEVPKLEAERNRITSELDSAAGDHEAVIQLSQELAAAIAAVDDAETRWLELIVKAESRRA